MYKTAKPVFQEGTYGDCNDTIMDNCCKRTYGEEDPNSVYSYPDELF